MHVMATRHRNMANGYFWTVVLTNDDASHSIATDWHVITLL